MLLQNRYLDVPDQFIQLIHGAGVGDLDMNGAVPCIRAVIIEDQIVGSPHFREAVYRMFDASGEFRVVLLTQDLRDRILQHLNAGLDDHDGDNGAEPRFQRHVEDQENARSDERGRGDNGIQRGVFSGVDERIRIHLFADALDVAAQQDLHHDCDGNYDQRDCAVVGRLGMEDLLYGLHKGSDAGIEHDHGDDHGAQIFDAPVSEWMLFVRFSARQLRSHDGDQRAAGVGDVVDGVQNDGNGVGHQADHRFERSKEHVGNDPDDAGPDDRLLTGTVIPVPFRHLLNQIDIHSLILTARRQLRL